MQEDDEDRWFSNAIAKTTAARASGSHRKFNQHELDEASKGKVMQLDLLGQPCEKSGEPSIDDAMRDVLAYGDVEPLCKLIEQQDVALWNDKRARYLIARIIRNGGKLGRGRGRRGVTKRIKDRRDNYIVSRLCHWKGFGLPIHGGDDRKPDYMNACIVVANELKRISGKYGWTAIEPDAITKLWKEHKPPAGMRALQEAYGRLLRDAAIDNADLRGKIKLEFAFDVDGILGGIK